MNKCQVEYGSLSSISRNDIQLSIRQACGRNMARYRPYVEITFSCSGEKAVFWYNTTHYRPYVEMSFSPSRQLSQNGVIYYSLHVETAHDQPRGSLSEHCSLHQNRHHSGGCC